MRDFIKYTEQLEEASRQLNASTPTKARLALLLLDNLAELFMYNLVNEYFAFLPQNIRDSPKERKEVYWFEGKVNFLSKKNAIRQNDDIILKFAHRIRNEAYHKGIVRDSIVVCITKIYFEVVCRLFKSCCGGVMIENEGQWTVFFKKYNMKPENGLDKVLLKISNNLLIGKDYTFDYLCAVLSKNLISRIDDTMDGLECFSTFNGFENMDFDTILKKLQFHRKFFDENEPPNNTEEWRKSRKKYKDFFVQYEPPVTVKRINSWRKIAAKLKAVRNPDLVPGGAIKKYDDIDNKLLPIELMINETIFEIEARIDAQIHP